MKIQNSEEPSHSCELAQLIFRSFESDGVSCAILHHFDFEEGGDIDFCFGSRGLDQFLISLRAFLKKEVWEVIQVLEHEQSGAYVVCGSIKAGGGFLLLDYCEDYRVRGHLVLTQEEMLKNQRELTWGGRGASEFAELCYRFVKAAAKKKNPEKITKELEELWGRQGETFSAWLSTRWGVEMITWSGDSVAKSLNELRQLLGKRKWSLDEVGLKLRRLLTPRGLLVECSEDGCVKLRQKLAPCFREVKEGFCSFRAVFGSTLIIEKSGKTIGWRRWVLKKMNCWMESSSSEEIIQFLAERTAQSQRWKI